MFDKPTLDNLFDELRDQYELEPDWEEIQRAAHLGVARLDGGVEIGDIDPRVAELCCAITRGRAGGAPLARGRRQCSFAAPGLPRGLGVSGGRGRCPGNAGRALPIDNGRGRLIHCPDVEIPEFGFAGVVVKESAYCGYVATGQVMGQIQPGNQLVVDEKQSDFVNCQ